MFKQFREVYPKFNQVVAQAVDVINRLDVCFDLVNYPDGQVAIQNSESAASNTHSGVGTAIAKTPEWERSFRYIQPEYKNTAIEEYLDWLEVPVYRTRIMVSRPKNCYSIHSDYSPRLHLPLITNKQCNFVFTKPAELIHMPADGKTYWVDTRREHTFMNGSLDHRLHLVMIVKE